jgi:hypothetical protein
MNVENSTKQKKRLYVLSNMNLFAETMVKLMEIVVLLV